MRLIIRLQRKGVRNHKYYWIVVMGRRMNQRGRFLEKVGMWYPRDNTYQKRSIVVNKKKIKHWIFNGAMCSPKVQYFFSLANITPMPWIRFGRCTMYKKTQEQIDKKNTLEEMKFAKQIKDEYDEIDYELIREKEEMNLFKRKMKGQTFLLYYLNYMNSEESDKRESIDVVNEITSNEDIGNLVNRSCQFYMLKKAYDSLENEKIGGDMNLSLLSNPKKEAIFDKLNELSKDGLLAIDKLTAYINKFDKSFFISSNTDKAMRLKQLKEQEKALSNLQILENLERPVTKSEFLEYALKHSATKPEEVINEVDEFFELKDTMKEEVTEGDMKDFLVSPIYDERLEHNVLSKDHIIGQGIPHVTPTKYPITPYPDLNKYDPEDYYDIRESVGRKITMKRKKNKWFELPHDYEIRLKKDYDYRIKANKGESNTIRGL